MHVAGLEAPKDPLNLRMHTCSSTLRKHMKIAPKSSRAKIATLGTHMNHVRVHTCTYEGTLSSSLSPESVRYGAGGWWSRSLQVMSRFRKHMTHELPCA